MWGTNAWYGAALSMPVVIFSPSHTFPSQLPDLRFAPTELALNKKFLKNTSYTITSC